MTLLCTLAEVRLYAGTQDSDTSTDAVVEQLIENASAFIERYCNRIFGVTTYVEVRNGNDRPRMMTNQSPITAVSSVQINGQSIAASTGALVAGYTFDEHSIYLRPGLGFERFWRGIQNVEFSYTAGFGTVPADVSQACIELIAFKLAKRNRIDKKNETLGQQQTIGFDTSDMPKGVQTALMPYQRFTVY